MSCSRSTRQDLSCSLVNIEREQDSCHHGNQSSVAFGESPFCSVAAGWRFELGGNGEDTSCGTAICACVLGGNGVFAVWGGWALIPTKRSNSSLDAAKEGKASGTPYRRVSVCAIKLLENNVSTNAVSLARDFMMRNKSTTPILHAPNSRDPSMVRAIRISVIPNIEHSVTKDK